MIPCPKCGSNGYFDHDIDRFVFYRCFGCGYSITAKHYAAKLAESKKLKLEQLSSY